MNILEKQVNDEIEGTFCYDLFENSLFNPGSLYDLLSELPTIPRTSKSSQIVKWIISGVDLCFTSHHDHNDLSQIKNYSPEIDDIWKECKQILEEHIMQ